MEAVFAECQLSTAGLSCEEPSSFLPLCAIPPHIFISLAPQRPPPKPQPNLMCQRAPQKRIQLMEVFIKRNVPAALLGGVWYPASCCRNHFGSGVSDPHPTSIQHLLTLVACSMVIPAKNSPHLTPGCISWRCQILGLFRTAQQPG